MTLSLTIPEMHCANYQGLGNSEIAQYPWRNASLG